PFHDRRARRRIRVRRSAGGRRVAAHGAAGGARRVIGPPGRSGRAVYDGVALGGRQELDFLGRGALRERQARGVLGDRDLPRPPAVRLELALFLSRSDEDEKRSLEQHGWRIRLAREVSASPREYSAYIGASRGEFSCAKPGHVRLENAWISDRTLCYLASAKPAVLPYPAPSPSLPQPTALL